MDELHLTMQMTNERNWTELGEPLAYVIFFEDLDKAIHVHSYWRIYPHAQKLVFVPESERRPGDIMISRGHRANVHKGRHAGLTVTIHRFDDKQNPFNVRFQTGGATSYIGANKLHFRHIHDEFKPSGEYIIKDSHLRFAAKQDIMRGTRKGPSTLDDDERSITRIRRRFDTGEMAAVKNKPIEGHLEDYREALMKEGVSERGIKKEMARAEADWKANLHKSLTTEDLLKIVLGLHEIFPNRGAGHE